MTLVTNTSHNFWEYNVKIAINILKLWKLLTPIPLAARTKAWVRGHSPAATVGTNPAGEMELVFCEFCVLSGRDVCDGPISRPEDSYWV
jgi:hypothetical protein